MMAQSRAESTRGTYNYGQYLNQFPPNTIKVIREFERIQKKKNIYICVCVCVCVCACVCVCECVCVFVCVRPYTLIIMQIKT